MSVVLNAKAMNALLRDLREKIRSPKERWVALFRAVKSLEMVWYLKTKQPFLNGCIYWELLKSPGALNVGNNDQDSDGFWCIGTFGHYSPDHGLQFEWLEIPGLGVLKIMHLPSGSTGLTALNMAAAKLSSASL